MSQLPFRVYGPQRERLIMRHKFCPVVWAEQLTNKFCEELLHLQEMDIFISIHVAEVWAAGEMGTLQSYWIHVSNSSDDYVHISSVLGRSYLSWNSETSFLMHKNKSVLESFLLFTSPPHDVISVLMPVPSMLFLITTEEPLSHWQCFGKCCCCPVAFTGWYFGSYRHHLSCVFLAGTSKCLPISLGCPGLFSHDHSYWVFFHDLSGFPDRIILVKFPSESFWIPLR